MTTNEPKQRPEWMNDVTHDILSATMDQARVDAFHADIERRTAKQTARLREFRNRPGNHVVHPFVTLTLSNLIDLIGYASDSTIDEYQNAIDPFIDAPDYAEEYASCGYDNDEFANPESAEYRAFATEVDEYFAVYNHLSEFERELLRSISDVISVVDDPDADLESVLNEWFDRVMTTIENL